MQYELDLGEDRHYVLKIDPISDVLPNQEDKNPMLVTVNLTKEAYRRVMEAHAFPERQKAMVRWIINDLLKDESLRTGK